MCLRRELRGVAGLELEAESRARAIRAQHAAVRRDDAVEQQLLDPRVVVEVLDVAEPRHGAPGVRVYARRGVRGQRQPERVAERARLEESGDATASGRIGLQHVYGAGLEHPAEVDRVVP